MSSDTKKKLAALFWSALTTAAMTFISMFIEGLRDIDLGTVSNVASGTVGTAVFLAKAHLLKS